MRIWICANSLSELNLNLNPFSFIKFNAILREKLKFQKLYIFRSRSLGVDSCEGNVSWKLQEIYDKNAYLMFFFMKKKILSKINFIQAVHGWEEERTKSIKIFFCVFLPALEFLYIFPKKKKAFYDSDVMKVVVDNIFFKYTRWKRLWLFLCLHWMYAIYSLVPIHSGNFSHFIHLLTVTKCHHSKIFILTSSLEKKFSFSRWMIFRLLVVVFL